MTFPPKVWDGVLRRLRAEIPAFAYEAWISPLASEPRDGVFVVLCPSSFHRDRVRDHFLPRIGECLRQELGHAASVELCVSPRRGGVAAANGVAVSAPASALPSAPSPGGRAAPAPSTARREALAVPLPGFSHRFDNFVVGPCNALAREAALAIAREQQISLNLLYICSQPGMGKTHLARAVAAEAEQRHTGGGVRYRSAESFTNEFMAALRARKTGEFKQHYRRGCKLLVIENVQFLASKSATQLEFFHTVQHVLDAGGRVVLTGDCKPKDMKELDGNLRSQLASGFLVELEAPDAQVRRAILSAKAAHGGVRIPPECLDLLVECVRGSVRDLESVLIQLVTTAALLKHPIDIALTRSAIAQKTSAGPTRPQTGLGVAEVIRAVASFFQTTPEKIASRSRRKEILLPRQLAIYLCRRYTNASVAEIGEAVGRDQPAVRGAIRKIERAILERAPLRYQVEALCDHLGGVPADPSDRSAPRAG